MPRWISINDFNIYLNIIKNGTEYNSVFTYNKLLLLSDFFENNDFVEKLVKENIIPNFDLSNVIDYLENSYLKLSSSKENSLPVSISWFELFIKAIDFVSKKFVFYLNPENSILLDKLSLLNKKILEELIDKSIEQIISHPFIFDDEILNESEIFNNLSQSNLCENINFLKHEVYEKLIDFLHKLRNTNNIFDLLMNEYLRISSNEVINEINNLPNATLNLEIPVDINNYYKEFLIDLNIYNKMVVFIVYYKKSDDSLNVSFKLKNNDYENESPPNLLNNKEKIKGEKKKNSQWNIFGSLSNFINFNNNDDGTQNFALNNNNNVFKKKIFFQNGKKNFNFKKEIDFNKFTIFKILSFLSVVTVNDEKNKTQVNINIIANNYNKSSFPIFKLNNFSKIIDDLITQQNKESCFKNNNLGNINNLNNIDINAFSGTIEFVSLKINLKPCNTHSAITSFILNNFQKFYFDNSIYKISKQFLMLLIKNRNHIKKNEDHVVIAFFNWCK